MNYRQGDVYLIATDRPKGLSEAPQEKRVLALGEVTGHRHEVINGTVWVDANGELYVEADEQTHVDHLTEQNVQTGDHARVDLAPGVYHVRIQRQYEPDGWRYVAD